MSFIERPVLRASLFAGCLLLFLSAVYWVLSLTKQREQEQRASRLLAGRAEESEKNQNKDCEAEKIREINPAKIQETKWIRSWKPWLQQSSLWMTLSSWRRKKIP